MRIFYNIIAIVFFNFIISCSNSQETDSIPPTLNIISPSDGSTVSEIVEIICVATDNKGVAKVELWIDGENTKIEDKTEPFKLNWNSTSYENQSTHVITVRAYDINGNSTDSEPLSLIVDNTNSNPQKINILNVNYSHTEMLIIWEKSQDKDFNSYELFHSRSLVASKTEISKIYDKNDTTFQLTHFDFASPNYFWINVIDSFGYKTLSNAYLVAEPKTTMPNLKPIIYKDNSFQLSWEKNNDQEFISYSVYESATSISGNYVQIFNSEDRDDLSLIVSNIQKNEQRFYILEFKYYWDLIKQSSATPASSFKKIIYGKNNSIFIMDFEGNNKIFITNGKLFDVSPDGEKILYSSDKSGAQDLYVVDIWGQNEVNITNDSYYETKAHFTSNNQKIYFLSDKNGNSDVFTANYDGSGITDITNSEISEEEPILSLNNDRLLFQTFISSGHHDIFYFNLNEGNYINITNHNSLNLNPFFNRTEDRILFKSDRNSSWTTFWSIYASDLNGENVQEITQKTTSVGNMHLSYDGKYIYTKLKVQGTTGSSLYKIDVNGSSQLKLIEDAAPIDISQDDEHLLIIKYFDSYQTIQCVRNNGSLVYDYELDAYNALFQKK